MASMRRSPILRWWRPRQKEMEALEALSRLAGPRQSLVRAEAPSHPAEAPTTGRRFQRRKRFLETGPDRQLCRAVCGQSLRMGRHEPYKRRGLLWLYHVCHGPLWGIPAPQLCGPGKLRKIHQIQPDAAWSLVFYSGSGGGINHVALYIGNGQVVHASSKRTGIKISSWNYRSPSKIVNVLGD